VICPIKDFFWAVGILVDKRKAGYELQGNMFTKHIALLFYHTIPGQIEHPLVAILLSEM
jgi:hypothetical protein